MTKQAYQLHPVGVIRRDEDGPRLEVEEAFRPALKELDEFSHVIVLWWANHLDSDEYRSMMTCNPPYAEEHETGMFATRSPIRPNPVAISTCRIDDVNEAAGIVKLGNIDAVDGTPIVDLKAYFPVCDRVKDAQIPGWLDGWPDWMPDEGLGLEPGEE